jgi:putative spermidine/putrescine transport system substrate-binding protein
VKISKLGKVALVAAVSASLAMPALTSASAASKFATATSASSVGGLAGLAAGCKAEGQLNIIATPGDWANYQEIFDGFKAAYGVKLDSTNPEGSSQEEIDAANANKGTTRSPDVFDIGLSTATKYMGTGTFAPYKVRTWNNLAGAAAVSANGEVTPNYTGTMTIGYDGALGTITKLDDLFKPVFKGKVALNGDPNVSSAGLNGVFMINKALGGSFNDVSKGVEWFKKLKAAGNFIVVNPTAATIASGQTPVVIDNGYNAVGVAMKMKAAGRTWKLYTPALVGSTYNAAVSAWAPHPACARLWMEYVLGEQGALAWSKGGATPTLWTWLVKTGRAPAAGVAVIGKNKVAADAATSDQATAARNYLKTAWPAAVA